MNRTDMIKRSSLGLLLVGLISGSVFAAPYSERDAKDAFPRYGLNEPIPNAVSATSITAVSVANFVHEMSKLPGGFEPKRYQRGEKPRAFNFAIKDLTIHDALDLFVKSDPDYSWQVSSGVINISPHNSILDFRVRSFTARNSDIFTAAEQLFRQVGRPEFGPAIKSLKERGQTSATYRAGLPRIHLNLAMGTLRDCLNELVRKDGVHDWQLYYHYSKEGDIRDFEIIFFPRTSGRAKAFRIAEEKRHIEFEKKALRDGFRKTKDGTWVK